MLLIGNTILLHRKEGHSGSRHIIGHLKHCVDNFLIGRFLGLDKRSMLMQHKSYQMSSGMASCFGIIPTDFRPIKTKSYPWIVAINHWPQEN